jgi:hypothetical protein
MVLGETARVLGWHAEWWRVRLDLDHYEGWVHSGYVTAVDHEIARGWRETAGAWSEGAVVQCESGLVRIPVRGRVGLSEGRVDLPDGRQGTILSGAITSHERMVARSRSLSPDLWALWVFSGTPYQWGGVTPWGADCSGLVQTTFLARGTILPRDAAHQVASGEAVAPGEHRPGDLLFFAERGQGVTHVAIAGEGDRLVHSTIRCGGFVVEPWTASSPAGKLRDRLVAVRRVAS